MICVFPEESQDICQCAVRKCLQEYLTYNLYSYQVKHTNGENVGCNNLKYLKASKQESQFHICCFFQAIPCIKRGPSGLKMAQECTEVFYIYIEMCVLAIMLAF